MKTAPLQWRASPQEFEPTQAAAALGGLPQRAPRKEVEAIAGAAGSCWELLGAAGFVGIVIWSAATTGCCGRNL